MSCFCCYTCSDVDVPRLNFAERVLRDALVSLRVHLLVVVGSPERRQHEIAIGQHLKQWQLEISLKTAKLVPSTNVSTVEPSDVTLWSDEHSSHRCFRQTAWLLLSVLQLTGAISLPTSWLCHFLYALLWTSEKKLISAVVRHHRIFCCPSTDLEKSP